MGADIGNQEKEIAELKKLSPDAKGYLAHHIRNSAVGLLGAIEMGDAVSAKEHVRHILADLERIGC